MRLGLWSLVVVGQFLSPLISQARADGFFDLRAQSTLALTPSWNSSALTDTLEIWGDNWHSRRLDAQEALRWDELGNPFSLQWISQWDSSFKLFVELPLRRDANAWLMDSWGSNLPLDPDELDINVPKEAWVFARWNFVNAKLGRFRPSSDFVPRDIAFSGVSWQDALQLKLGGEQLRYELIWSSLNPWLNGDPVAHTNEWLLQSTAQVPNQHGRVYDDPFKTLVSHRLTTDIGFVHLGLREIAMIGGIAPTLRTAQPFMFLHNNYNDGLNNTLFAFEFVLRSKWSSGNGRVYGEYALDDANAGSGEQSGDNPAISAWQFGAELSQQSEIGTFRANLEFVQTDPAFGNSPLPLLKLTDRHVSRTNSRLRDEPGYFDTYVADLPIGYLRGPNCRDLWLDLAWQRTNLEVQIWSAWLRRGSVRLESPWGDALSGTGTFAVEDEGRWGAKVAYQRSSLNYWAGIEARDLDRLKFGLHLGIQGNWSLYSSTF